MPVPPVGVNAVGLPGVADPKWIAIAKGLCGIKEITGPKHNPEIVQFWKDIKRGGIKDDETPWCAAFVGACLERAGVVSSRFESALSYAKYGTRLALPVYGCIGVRTRNGGGHVGFVVGRQANGNILMLGGNQSNQVSITTFEPAGFTAFVYPKGFTPPDALPILTLANVKIANSLV